MAEMRDERRFRGVHWGANPDPRGLVHAYGQTYAGQPFVAGE